MTDETTTIIPFQVKEEKREPLFIPLTFWFSRNMELALPMPQTGITDPFLMSYRPYIILPDTLLHINN